MKTLILIILAFSILGCNPAALRGFQQGLYGIPIDPPRLPQPQLYDMTRGQRQPSYGYGTITTPSGRTYQYNSVQY